MSRVAINATFPGVPAGVNGRPELRPRPYRWRDPQRVSPERLAELAARDARLAALEASYAGDRTQKARNNCKPPSPEQKAAYYAARDQGLPMYKSAAAAGVSTKTASKWEKRRKEDARVRDIPAGCTCQWDWDGHRRWLLRRPVQPGCPWHTAQEEALAS